MTTVNISSTADREFLEDNEASIAKMQRLAVRAQAAAAEAASWAQRQTDRETERDDFGDKVRRGLVRYKPATDGVLEAQIEDIELEYDQGVVIKVHTNAEAVAYRATL